MAQPNYETVKSGPDRFDLMASFASPDHAIAKVPVSFVTAGNRKVRIKVMRLTHKWTKNGITAWLVEGPNLDNGNRVTVFYDVTTCKQGQLLEAGLASSVQPFST